MTVLRDAGAAAIYGTNAANGVVLITTKRGRAGQPRSSSTPARSSASTITRIPSMLNAEQFRTAVEQFAPVAADSQLLNANTEWFDPIDRTGFGQEHNVALSGGGTTNDYRVSFNFLDQHGIIDANSAQRIGLGLNYNQLLAGDRLNMRFSLRGSRTEDHFTPLGVLSNAAQYGPTQPIEDPGSPTGFYEWGPPNNSLTSADNPVAILNLAEEKAETYRAIGNMQTEYRLPWVEGLKANLNLGFDASDGKRRNFTPSVLHGEQKTGRGGQQTRYNPQQTSTVLETYLNYTTPRPVGPGILDLTGGYSWSKTHIDSLYYEGTGLSSDEGGTEQIVPAANTTNIEFEQQSKLISFFGRLNYNINDKYLLAASLRRRRLVPVRRGERRGARSRRSRSAGGCRRRRSCSGIEGLSDLKLRGSWAKTGNQAFGNYLAVFLLPASATTRRQYQFGDTVFTTSRPSAVDPEHQVGGDRGLNVGLDFGFCQPADHRRDRLLRQGHRRPDLHRAGGGGSATCRTSSPPTSAACGTRASSSASVPESWMAGNGGLGWQADFTAARNKNKLRSITPFGGSLVEDPHRRASRAAWAPDPGPRSGLAGELVLCLRAHAARTASRFTGTRTGIGDDQRS